MTLKSLYVYVLLIVQNVICILNSAECRMYS